MIINIIIKEVNTIMIKKHKLLVYFAHPYSKKDSHGEREIISILEKKGYEVVNPFDGEGKFLEEQNHSTAYYKDADGDVGSALWDKDLKQVKKCNALLVWLPEKGIGSSKEEVYAIFWRKEIIIISPFKHPSFAYEVRNVKTRFLKKKRVIHYSSIKNFELEIPFIW